jgi:hypothetical protein
VSLGLQRVMIEPLEVYTLALGAMNDVIFVHFNYVHDNAGVDYYAQCPEVTRNLPSSVTSIDVPDSHQLPAIQRDTLLFINDRAGSNKIETFLQDN